MDLKYANYIPLYKVKTIEKSIIIYGAGTLGELLLHNANGHRVLFFIDSYTEERNSKLGYSVYSLEMGYSIVSHMLAECVFLIGSIQYAEEMSENLSKLGLVLGVNFFYVDYMYDDTESNMIRLNKSIYTKKKGGKNEGEVLVSLDPWYGVGEVFPMRIAQGFVSDFLAERYNSTIKGFIPDDILNNYCKNPFILPSTVDYYKSLNIEQIISMGLSETQKKESILKYNEVEKKINSFDDWNKIYLYGLNFAAELNRFYCRFGQLEFDPRNRYYLEQLKYGIEYIVFWHEYFETHDVQSVVLIDGIYHEGIINKIANTKKIPVYAINPASFMRILPENSMSIINCSLRSVYDSLAESERKTGIAWGKKQMELLTQGSPDAVIPYRGKNKTVFRKHDYSSRENKRKSKSIRVVICPHTFEDDYMQNGHLVCGNMFSWLEVLGEESLHTNYEWFLKPHPGQGERDKRVICGFTERFPHIKVLPEETAPDILSEMGISYAFTVSGSIGHEYPYIGINVVNAGDNPHMSFDFNINPHTTNELRDIIKKLDQINYKPKMEDLYKYYYVAYGRGETQYGRIRTNKLIMMKEWCPSFEEWHYNLKTNDNLVYKSFINSYSKKRLHEIRENVFNGIQFVDNWSNELTAKYLV